MTTTVKIPQFPVVRPSQKFSDLASESVKKHWASDSVEEEGGVWVRPNNARSGFAHANILRGVRFREDPKNPGYFLPAGVKYYRPIFFLDSRDDGGGIEYSMVRRGNGMGWPTLEEVRKDVQDFVDRVEGGRVFDVLVGDKRIGGRPGFAALPYRSWFALPEEEARKMMAQDRGRSRIAEF